jgi:hypothetical protein
LAFLRGLGQTVSDIGAIEERAVGAAAAVVL